MSERGRIARVLRIGVKLLCAGGLLLLFLIGATLLVLQTNRGRDFACIWVLGLVNDTIPGEIRVQRCAALSPRLIDLRGVSVRDPSEREILQIETVDGEPDLASLLDGTVRFKRARAEGATLQLVDHGDRLAIASAFVSPNETSVEGEEGSGISLVFDLIELARGRLTALPDAMIVDEVEVRASLAWRESLILDVDHAQAKLLQRNEQTALLDDASGTLRFGEFADVEGRAALEAFELTAALDFTVKGPLERLSLNATIETLGGRVDLRANNDEGRVEAQLAASDLSLVRAPGEARGTVGAKLDVVLVFSQPTPGMDALERMSAEGDIAVSSLSISDLRVDRVAVEGRIDGLLPTPRVQATIEAQQVARQGQSIDSLKLTIDGEAGDYRAQGEAPLPNGWIIGVDLDSHLDWPRVGLDGEVSLANTPLSPITAELSRLVIEPREAISADSVSIVGNGIDLDAAGRYGLDRASDLSFRIRSLDIAKLSDALDIPRDLEGAFRGRGRFRGSVQAPRLTATLHLENGAIEGVPVESLVTKVRLDTPEEVAEVSVSADLGDHGQLSLRTSAALGNARSAREALASARYDARLVVDSLSVGLLSRLSDAVPTAKGTVSAEGIAKGKLDTLGLSLVAHGSRISTASLSPTDLHLDANLEDGKARARVEATNAEGAPMVATAAAHLSLRELFANDGIGGILSRPWKVSARVPEQRLVALPLDVDAPPSARGSFEARASGGDGAIEADLEADIRFPSVPPSGDARQFACVDRKPARLRMSGQLRDRATEVEVNGYVAHEQVLEARARAETPLGKWIARGWPDTWPEVEAYLDLDPVALGTVPLVCAHAAGEVQARVDATSLFDSDQEAAFRLEARQLVLNDTSPVDAVLRAEASATVATAKLEMHSDEQELVRIEARVPLEVQVSSKPIGLGSGAMRISGTFDEAPLAVLLAPLPIVARPDGRIDGRLDVEGEARDFGSWKMRGAVELADASMTLKDPFLRLDGVDADLEIQPDRWVVNSLSTRDREGHLQASGAIGVSEWEPREVSLSLKADDYPLRHEGVPLATLNGQLEVSGDLGADPRVLRVELGKDISLVLPDELRYGVQSLTQHPLVIYEDQPGFDRSLSVEEALRVHAEGGPLEETGGPLVVHVTSMEPFWVRRPDFSIQLAIDLEVHSGEDASWLQGEVFLRRGFLVVLNKNFDLKSGTILFTGSMPVDPTVELSAQHRLRSGYVVTIDVEGRISDLELTFSSNAPGANTNAEVIALLLGVSRHGPGDQQAESQTRSVLAGITAGLVGSLARRELGQYAPIIALESEGTAETTSIRAGVTIGDLIPESWQDVLLGVYVEGMLAGSDEGPHGGFLLELLFPHHLSTTTTYEQPDNWSLDFLWQP